jgi:curved DNA-binding protein CbpA
LNTYECYQILELNQNSSIDDVKSQFRRLALKYHPDTLKNQEILSEKYKKLQNQKFMIIKDAYE